jgi:hypothetical protein
MPPVYDAIINQFPLRSVATETPVSARLRGRLWTTALGFYSET